MTVTHSEFGLELSLPANTPVHIDRVPTTLGQLDAKLCVLAMDYVAALWKRVRATGGTYSTEAFVNECAAMERNCVWPGACCNEQRHKDAVSIVRQLAEAGALTQS